MNKTRICFALVTALAANGVVHAESLSVGSTLSLTANNGTVWSLSNLQGGATLNFSDQLISALNTAKVDFAPQAPAVLTAPFTGSGTTKNYLKSIDTNGDGKKEAQVFASAPGKEVSGTYTNNVFNVSTTVTTGGSTQITIKNGATEGAGDLSITNLRAVVGDRAGFAGTVYADISSTTAGFTNRKDYALWTFDQLLGTTGFILPQANTVSTLQIAPTLHGLFFVNSTEGLDLFSQALRLNAALGKPALKAVDNRNSTTNFDPLTNKVAGFGWVTGNFSVTATPTPAIPEPSTYALMGVGLVGLVLVAHRRKVAA